MPAPKRSRTDNAAAPAGRRSARTSKAADGTRKIDDILRSRRSGRRAEPKAAPAKENTAPAVEQKASKPGRSKPGRSKAEPAADAAQPRGRRYLEEVEEGGRAFRVGDAAYAALQPGEWDSEDECEACVLCGHASRRVGRRQVPLLECDGCLRGFHLDCLDPPLPAVPEGDWRCPGCVAGESAPVPAAANLRTARERMAAGQWGLVRIEALWREPDGSAWFAGRWFCRPEETHTGRQAHHGAREVFLTEVVDANEVGCLQRCVHVCRAAALADYAGPLDVCVCEYEYDAAWKRFRQLDGGGPGDAEPEWAASGGEESDYEAERAAARPLQALWAAKGMLPRAGKGRDGSRKRRAQGGGEWALGASEVPAERQAGGSELARTRRALALTAVLDTLPCREAERATVTAFVREAVEAGAEGGGRCLYISGVPGTGKTATVLEVMRRLKAEEAGGGLPGFQFVELNGLRLPSPQHAYTALYEALTGRHFSPGIALAHLEELFAGGRAHRRSTTTVLLVDEMDLLVTRNQQVLYNLFEWPTRRGSRLAVLGVANTMDLPERLMPRIASRLGGRRVVFQPYTRPQLQAIVDARLQQAGLGHAFAPAAVNFACSKVAGVSGDVRRLLQLCRKAAEACEEEGCAQVATRHVQAAVEQMFSAAHMRLLEACCRADKLLLACLLLEMRARGRADAALEDVAERLGHLAAARGEPGMLFGDCQAAARRLAARRLLLAEAGGQRLRMRLSLNVPRDDVAHVLQEDAAIPWLRDLAL